MKATEILKIEHQVILKQLEELSVLLEQKVEGVLPSIEDKIQFLHEYADDFHHAKEEDIYFPWMVSKNQNLEFGPIQGMIGEHAQCRMLVEQAEGHLKEFKVTKIAVKLLEMKKCLLTFIPILQNHIRKEDNILYMMAEQLNTSGDGDNIMLSKFEEVSEKFKENKYVVASL